MNNLEACGLIAPHSCGMSLVTRLALPRSVFENNFRGFKYFDWQWMRTILADGFKQTRDKCCSHDLKFEALGVGNLYCFVSVVLMIEPFKILLM
jgi:hypothetical protein